MRSAYIGALAVVLVRDLLCSVRRSTQCHKPVGQDSIISDQIQLSFTTPLDLWVGGLEGKLAGRLPLGRDGWGLLQRAPLCCPLGANKEHIRFELLFSGQCYRRFLKNSCAMSS